MARIPRAGQDAGREIGIELVVKEELSGFPEKDSILYVKDIKSGAFSLVLIIVK